MDINEVIEKAERLLERTLYELCEYMCDCEAYTYFIYYKGKRLSNPEALQEKWRIKYSEYLKEHSEYLEEHPEDEEGFRLHYGGHIFWIPQNGASRNSPTTLLTRE